MLKIGLYHSTLQCIGVFQLSKMWDNNYMAEKIEDVLWTTWRAQGSPYSMRCELSIQRMERMADRIFPLTPRMFLFPWQEMSEDPETHCSQQGRHSLLVITEQKSLCRWLLEGHSYIKPHGAKISWRDDCFKVQNSINIFSIDFLFLKLYCKPILITGQWKPESTWEITHFLPKGD